MREKIRVEGYKATITYTSAAVADKVLHKFKGNRIGKYDVSLRPFAKDSYTVFVGSLNAGITLDQFEDTFKHYQPIVSCNLSAPFPGANTINGSITFGSK